LCRNINTWCNNKQSKGRGMDNKEKQTLVTLITFIVIFTGYILYVYNNYVVGDAEILNDLKFCGKAFLIFIPIAILAQIIIYIVFSIINKIITDEDLPTKNDERDKLIELKAIRVSHWIFTLGFLLAMGSLAIGMKPYIMLIILFFSGFISSVFSELTKLYFYRKGF